jgi:ATPase subunit of ABC transporter with duplicated ATPase domains
MTVPLIEVSDATIATSSARVLFHGLSLSIARERVALVGRNGVGKSTLLAVLAGSAEAERGRVRTRCAPHFVPQLLPADDGLAASRGELRKRALDRARRSGSEILLLDEPTEDLDVAGVEWLRRWLSGFPGCVVAASHDRRLLGDFEHFFVASESGCRYFRGTLAELDRELAHEHERSERRYAANLSRLAAFEEHTLHVARRKARKKRSGRCRELDRATSRMRLNQKRDHAQVSHGRLAAVREERLDLLRQWSKSTRRALGVSLPLELEAPELSPAPDDEVLVASGVSASACDRALFRSVDLRLGRGRLGVIGPNGSGKTTLIQILLGRRSPDSGTVASKPWKIGAIEQCGSDWMLEDSLVAVLGREDPSRTTDALAALLVAHKFPLALAERPLRSLSPGERVRAALVALFRRAPAAEVLVLDEPSYSLDLVGWRAMTNALRTWPGGLVVASHDLEFLRAIDIEHFVRLGS